MSYRSRAHKGQTTFKSKSKEESDEIVLLRAAHSKNLVLLNELFPSWSDEDLLYTLQDTQGDLELSIARITEGFASQWDEVKIRKTKKEAPRTNTIPRAQPRFIDEKKSRGKPNSTPKDQGTQPATNGFQTSTFNSFDIKSEQLPEAVPSAAELTHSTRVLAKPVKTPVPQNTWASRVAKGNSTFTSSRDSSVRTSEKTHPHTTTSNDFTDTLSNSVNNFPGLGDSNSLSNNSTQQAASPSPQTSKPVANSWAKIASRAAQPKPAPTSNKSSSSIPAEPESVDAKPTAENTTQWTQQCDETIPEKPEESLAEPVDPVDDVPVESDDLTHDNVQIPDTHEKPSSVPRSPSPHSLYQLAESNVTISSDVAAQMDEINKKFAAFGTNELLSMANNMKSDSASEASNAQIHLGSIQNLASDSLSSKHANIALGTPPGIASMRSSRTINTNKSFVAAASGITNEDNQSLPENNNVAPEAALLSHETKIESSIETEIETPVQDHSTEHLPISATEHRGSNQQTAHPQINKATINSGNQSQASTSSQGIPQGYSHEFNQYYQPQGMAQGMQHPHGAPGHLPPIHPQMIHPQNQGNYMPYYQYPYPPAPYNPYPSNNYTLQFAQKSLGGYDEQSQGGFNQSPSGNASAMQDQGAGNAHGYDKSNHGKHKGYDSNGADSGTPSHPGAPINYGGFGYGGIPNYQPPGGPNDAMYYHHYYNQSAHPNMFSGYPSAHGPQHIPPHVQQQHQGYGSPLQQHQGHQASPQSQYPQSQQSPHHYSSHQNNPNMRYQGWNN